MMNPANKALSIKSTNLGRWRLKTTTDRYRWLYLSTSDAEQQPQSFAERYFLGIPTGAPDLPQPNSFRDTAVNSLSFYQRLQLGDGQWGCGFGGPSPLLPGVVFAMYISNTAIPEEWRIEMVRYISRHVNEDGGWGFYPGGDTILYATTMYYVVLRILGMEPHHPLAVRARARLLSLGGAIAVPQWGKHWLSCLNLYEWDGVNPVPPEIWLLPDWTPFHPSRWWVHSRAVYLPISYLYANKCQIPLNDFLKVLRQEIFAQPFINIDFAQHRNTVAPTDIKRPNSFSD